MKWNKSLILKSFNFQDYDETEVPSDKSLSTSGTLEKEKKKKKKFLIL